MYIHVACGDWCHGKDSKEIQHKGREGRNIEGRKKKGEREGEREKREGGREGRRERKRGGGGGEERGRERGRGMSQ